MAKNIDIRKGKIHFKGSTNTHVSVHLLVNVLACRIPGDSASKEAGRWGGTQLTHSGIIIQTSKSQEKFQVQMFSRRDIVRNYQDYLPSTHTHR